MPIAVCSKFGRFTRFAIALNAIKKMRIPQFNYKFSNLLLKSQDFVSLIDVVRLYNVVAIFGFREP